MKVFTRLTLLTLVVAGCATVVSAEVVDRIVAVVNRKVITFYQLQEAEKAFASGENVAQKNAPVSQDKALDLLIDNELIRQNAEEQGITASEEDVNAALADIKQRNKMLSEDELKQAIAQEGRIWDEFLDDIRTQIKMAKLTNREVRSKVELNEADVQAYYDAHKAEFKQVPSSVRVCNILLKVKDGATDAEIAKIKAKADEIVQLLRNGGDFAALAKQYSEHPTAQARGEMGTFKQGDLVPPFDIVFTLPIGGISDPVRSNYGFHILYVPEKFTGDEATYQQAKAQIRNKLIEEKSNDLYQKWLASLKENAHIEIKK
jgi:peptidyl-prolyl cis-trans isomerase SurA